MGKKKPNANGDHDKIDHFISRADKCDICRGSGSGGLSTTKVGKKIVDHHIMTCYACNGTGLK